MMKWIQKKNAIQKECRKFIAKDDSILRKFNKCTKEDQEWVINCLSSGKGIIPYEMVTNYGSLNISRKKGEFFFLHYFYSDLKDDIVLTEDYKNVKKFWEIMDFENLVEFNKIYNFQDAIILCEIFEQRSNRLRKMFIYNLRKCNSISSFSGCAQRDQSKCSIALPTDAEHVIVFEKTLIGGFSCVNTRLAFDTQILISDKKIEKVLFDLNING